MSDTTPPAALSLKNFAKERVLYLGKPIIKILLKYPCLTSTIYVHPKKQRRTFEKTKYRNVSIGERRPPNSEGKPGYIRVDTVHQGDQDGVKGVYHINAVDEISQFEVVLSCQKISEQFLIPVLTEMLETFPFNIQGFHEDNGSQGTRVSHCTHL